MRSGIMIVTEALSSMEDVKAARALVGPGGFLLARTFARRKWKIQEEFRIVPSLFCMPDQALRRKKPSTLTPWAADALMTCAPNLDAEIAKWKPKVILALGETAFTALVGIEQPIMSTRGYVFRDRKDRCWVIPSFDPNWIQQGNNVYAQVLMHDVDKALRIIREGFSFEMPICLMDPPLQQWEAYVKDFLKDPSRPLGVDIETPWKSAQERLGKEEDEIGVDVTYTINRFSCAFEKDRGASVEWNAMYVPGIRMMLEAASKVEVKDDRN